MKISKIDKQSATVNKYYVSKELNVGTNLFSHFSYLVRIPLWFDWRLVCIDIYYANTEHTSARTAHFFRRYHPIFLL